MTTTAYDLDNELNAMADAELRREARGTHALPARTSALPDEDKNLAVITHLGTIAAMFASGGLLDVVVPAIAWVLWKDRSPALASHLRGQLNYQLTLLIVALGAIVLSAVTFGLGAIVAVPVVAFFWIAGLVNTIRATLAASRGEDFEFPFALQLLK